MKTGKNIGSLLSQISKSERLGRRADPAQTDERQRPTSFGAPLVRAGESRFHVDMSEVLVLAGLSGLATELAENFREAYRGADADQLITHVVNNAATPELAALGVRRLVLHCQRPVAALLAQDPVFLAAQLRRVLGALQNQAVRGDLFAPAARDGAPVPGRLFPFAAAGVIPEGFALLEYDVNGAFLRVTFEMAEDQRLYLKRIPHRIVLPRELTLFEQDVEALAGVIALGLNQAGRNQRDFHAETADRQPAIFSALHEAGLRTLDLLRFTWPPAGALNLLAMHDPELIRLLARALLLLQEESAIRLLADGCELELLSEKRRLFLDMSRRGTCLNLSLERRRRQADLRSYLCRLPQLESLAAATPGVLAGIRIVFIHHFTAETLAVIESLREMGCAFFHGLFIRYKGLLPDAYLEALMALPERQFVFHSLSQIETEAQLLGRYLLARDFSPVEPLAALDAELRQAPLDYFKAMRAAACHITMRQLLEARRTGQQVLLIEDGGYVAPLFNRWAAENITLEEALRRCLIPPDEYAAIAPRPEFFAGWLRELLVAGIEHTRNGYDQLMEVKRHFGPLVCPAYTIALSDYKNSAEALGCAASLLMAAEYLMAGQGDSLLHRHALVIGSRGFIGRHLLAQLAARNGADHVLGVDLTATATTGLVPEYKLLAEIPPHLLAKTDLIMGITGHAVLTPDIVTQMLLSGAARRLYLVSGSTKNVELAQITDWLQNLRNHADARIGEHPVHLEPIVLRDPLTEIAQGSIIRIHFDGARLPQGVTPATPWKDLVIAADGMPLNFSFFGVPGEIMDRVMAQLLALCKIAMQHRAAPPPPDIYALDYNLNEQGQLLEGRALP